jgi:hypothetical protein
MPADGGERATDPVSNYAPYESGFVWSDEDD